MEGKKWLRVLPQLSQLSLSGPLRTVGSLSNKLFVNIPKELIYEGWTYVSQKLINKKIASMPERLQAVKDGEGKMTSY